MKRFAIGTALWLAIVGAVVVIALRWPAMFWLLVLSASLYLVFGRKANIDLRVGVANDERERRWYAAVVWKRAAHAKSETAIDDSKFDVEKLEDRV